LKYETRTPSDGFEFFSMPRFYCPTPLVSGELLDLPHGAARHAQVLRLQPGDSITLFNGGPGTVGSGGEFSATIIRMGRNDVQVQVGAHHPVQREAALSVHLAVGVPANERMDWLVEKATELGVSSIQPLMTERSVLRLTAERAEKKVAHWQSVAIAACEQCGGNRVPLLQPVLGIGEWLKQRSVNRAQQSEGAMLLSLRSGSRVLRQAVTALGERDAITFLSGPEGGLSSAEEDAALACGFVAVTLGPRVLRAETSALAALATLLV
jgi:16S rRNA (uracil1498-N3)-methyltransferase